MYEKDFGSYVGRVLLVVLSGCSSKTASGGYKDGTYKAEQPKF
ncbi:hypothetical protein TheetDRAFT_3064 [Thermoanaerobacter ethanolicus JW 200]|nr:hypothetical protein TheetDRAFT_3064 [Thermoanaerobacter ethanolicus JW 200]